MFSTLFVLVLVLAFLNIIIGTVAYSNDYFDDEGYETLEFDKLATYAIAGATIIFIRAYRNVRAVINAEISPNQDKED